MGNDAGCFESNEERDEYLTRIAKEKLFNQHRAHTAAESRKMFARLVGPRVAREHLPADPPARLRRRHQRKS